MKVWRRLTHVASAPTVIWRRLHARLSGVQVGRSCTIGPDAEVALASVVARTGRIPLGDRTHLARGALLHPYGGYIETGIDVYIGPYTTIYGHGGVTIGKDTLIAMHCRILSSTHSIPSVDTIIRSLPDTKLPTSIGTNVWLGAGVTILGGVRIGDRCVVGAGAVVTEDLPDGAIAVGIPARNIGART